jgi:3-hydroxyacyl-[acyl-carrier-protein] dehydratase
MRWMWVDRFVEFERGRRAVSVKNVSLAEEQLDMYQPGYPVMPSSLIVEGLAQTGGMLVGEYNGFKERVVLAKLGKAEFHSFATPGDTLTYTTTVEDIKPTGAIVKGVATVGDRVVAEVELVFAHLDKRFDVGDLFEPDELLRMLRLLCMYDVGRKEDGSPLDIPSHMQTAEDAANAADAY